MLERAHLPEKIRIAHVCVELTRDDLETGVGVRREILRPRGVACSCDWRLA